MELKWFGVGEEPGNSRDQKCWESGHPKSLIPPRTPACAYGGVQGFKTGLEEHPRDGITGRGSPPQHPLPLSSLKPPPRTPLRGSSLATEPHPSGQGGGEQPRIPAGARGRKEGDAGEVGAKPGGGGGPSPPPQGLHRLLNSSFFLLQSIWGARLLVRFWCARSLATASGMLRSRREPDAEWRLSSSCASGWGARGCVSPTMPPQDSLTVGA